MYSQANWFNLRIFLILKKLEITYSQANSSETLLFQLKNTHASLILRLVFTSQQLTNIPRIVFLSQSRDCTRKSRSLGTWSTKIVSHGRHGCRAPTRRVFVSVSTPFAESASRSFCDRFFRLVLSRLVDELCNLPGSKCHSREIPANWSKINTSTIFSLPRIPGRVFSLV